jgi:hypothetical protein
VAVSDVGAATPITFGTSEGGGLVIGSNCFEGYTAGDAAIHMVWKSASGKVKARVDLTSYGSGYWQYCSDTKTLRAGDTIKAVVGGTSRKLTMPTVSLASDRMNKFHGRGPANATGDLWYSAGWMADYQKYKAVSTDSRGRWSAWIKNGLSGRLYAEVDWVTAQGDHFTARGYTPYVSVTLGSTQIGAGGTAATSGLIKLRAAADDSLRGRANVSFGEYGEAAGQFVDANGDPVAVQVGDRIVSSLAPNLDWHVPAISGTAKVAKDLVNGQCNATEISPAMVEVRVARSGKVRGWDVVSVAADGTFTADLTGRATLGHKPADVRHGDSVTINCYYDTGDIVAMAFQVP